MPRLKRTPGLLVKRLANLAGMLLCSTSCAVNAQVAHQSGSTVATSSPNLYFSSPAVESQGRAALHARVPASVNALKTSSDAALPQTLRATEGLLSDLQTHAAYLKLATLKDTGDQGAKDARDQVGGDERLLISAMHARLQALRPNKIARMGTYALLARTVQREKQAASPEAEQYRDAVVVPAEQDLADAYDREMEQLSRPKALLSHDTLARRTALSEWDAEYDVPLRNSPPCWARSSSWRTATLSQRATVTRQIANVRALDCRTRS